MSRGRVAVVGGGLAGIAAALDCARAGAEVTLLEVRPRLGGAAFSFSRGDLRLDNGQHVFLRCCTAYRGLLERLGSTRHTFLQPRLEIPVIAPGGRVSHLRRGKLPAPLHLAASLARYPHLTRAERLGAARAALALSRLDPADPELDRRTLGEWLAEHGQGPSARQALWDLIALPTLNLPADQASLALGAFVFRTGVLSHASAGDIGFHRLPLSEVIGDPARRVLTEAGVAVKLGWRADRVRTAGGGWEVEGRDDGLSAEAVIVAVPHHRAAELLPAAVTSGVAWPQGLRGSPIVNLHVVYDRQVCGLPFAAGVRTPVQYVFDRTETADLNGGQYLAVSLSGADAEMPMSRDALAARFLPALAELFPAARQARVERFLVSREHTATFRAVPGVARLRPVAATARAGLALAGAWTATGWPATLEGAVLSGQSAARTALSALGATRRPEVLA